MPTTRSTLGRRAAVTNETSAPTHEVDSSARAPAERLPPLNAIQAFDAAARHLSFNRAAEELHLTASAISHRIRALEEFLGVSLFHRLTRHVALTEAGTAYVAAVRAGLARIAAATGALRRQERSRRLSVSVAPTFASRLIQRLPQFHQLHPEIEIYVFATTRLVDFSRAEADVGIRHGTGAWPGLASHYLQSDERFPVCSPMLLRARRLERADEVRHFTLLHALTRPHDWRRWLEQAGVRGVDDERGPKFETSQFVMEAAISGLGIAIVERAVARDALQAGRLVAPFELTLRTEKSYYLVYPRRKQKDKTLALFRAWVLDCFAEQPEKKTRRVKRRAG